MTEANGLAQGQDTVISQPAPTSAPAASVSEERTFKQQDVDAIVKRVKHEAVESYRKMQQEQPQYAAQKFDAPAPNQGMTPDEVRKLAAEETERLRGQWVNEAHAKTQEQESQRMAQEFFGKLNTGKEKYSDFEKVVGDIDYVRFPNAVHLANSYIDNTVDVMYELGKDRIKMANLEQLANMSPRDAIVQIQRLSQSIKENDEAAKLRLANQPLSQLRPTNTGTDNGVKSVSDYRKRYRV